MRRPSAYMFAFSGMFFFSYPLAWANNVTVANVEIVGQDAAADTVKIEFDISWNNAWFDSINKDAVWVFAKYCTSSCTTGGATWSHVKLAASGTNPTNFSRGTKNSGAFSAVNIKVPSDKTGGFIEPANQGSGTLDFKNVQFVWDYATDGISDATAIAATTYVKVFAIEMTYIPQGGFYAGDGNSSDGEFSVLNGATTIPPAVLSEQAILFRASGTGTWYYRKAGSAGDASGS